MTKQNLKISVFLLLLSLPTAFFLFKTALAHTPSPSVCNDATCNIDVQDFSFQPADETIRPPNSNTEQYVTVAWVNHGAFTHSVTSGTSGSPDGIFNHVLPPGSTFELRINQTVYMQILSTYTNGVVPYYCTYHYLSGMTATFTVTGEPIPEFSPPTLLLTLILTLSIAFLLKKKIKQP